MEILNVAMLSVLVLLLISYVANCYYHSEFMGKTSAKDIFESFSACLSGISKNKLRQVSFDGPNVNLSFLDLLEEDKVIPLISIPN